MVMTILVNSQIFYFLGLSCQLLSEQLNILNKLLLLLKIFSHIRKNVVF